MPASSFTSSVATGVGLFSQEQAISFLNVMMTIAQQTSEMLSGIARVAEKEEGREFSSVYRRASATLAEKPRSEEELTQIAAKLTQVYPEMRSLFQYICTTYAGLRFGGHGLYQVRVAVPQLSEFLQQFYIALARFVPFSTGRFSQMPWPEAKLCVQDVIRTALERSLKNKTTVVEPSPPEDIFPADSVSCVGLSRNTLERHVRAHGETESEVSRVQLYPVVDTPASVVARSELARSQVGEPAPSQVSQVARSQVGESAPSQVSQVARSQVGEPARRQGSQVARSQVGEPARSQVGEPARSQVGEPARSQVGEGRDDMREGFMGQPCVDEARAAARSEVGEAARSEVVTERSEAGEDAQSEEGEAAHSEAGEAARSEVGDIAQSQVGKGERSEASEEPEHEVRTEVSSRMASSVSVGSHILDRARATLSTTRSVATSTAGGGVLPQTRYTVRLHGDEGGRDDASTTVGW